MGPVFFTKKILKHGSNFLTDPKFWDFRMMKTLKITKFVKNGPIPPQKKSLTMGTLFAKMTPKWPLNMGRGFEARAAHSHPNQIWVPPV